MYLGNPGVSQTSCQGGLCFPSGQVYHYPLSPTLIAFHSTATNVNGPMVAGGDCSVIVPPSSMTTVTTEQQPFKLHFVVEDISRCADCKQQQQT